MTVWEFIKTNKSTSVAIKRNNKFIRYWDCYSKKLERKFLTAVIKERLEDLPAGTPVLEVY